MDKILSQIKQLLLEEKINDAKHQLLQVDKENLPRELKGEFARLARLAGAPSFTVRVLHSHTRNKIDGNATEAEKAEYALALGDLGLYKEASDILHSLPRSPLFQYYLARTFAHQRRSKDVLNILDWIGSADKLPREEMIHFEWIRLWAKTEENPNERASTLLEWENFSKHHSHYDPLPVKKWKAILRLLENPGNPKTLEEIKSIRNEAVEKEFWESVRDCDRFEATVTKNEKLLFHTYFGTPFEAFRERLLKEYRIPISVPKFYDWTIGNTLTMKNDKAKWTFDLLMGERIGGKTPIKVGKGMHRLLSCLASDFYRSQRIPQLFSQLYPDEQYDPVTSSPRVHQILNRLRIWFKKNLIPLNVEERERAYHLTSAEGCILRIPQLESSADPSIIHLNKLKEIFPNQVFSANDAGKALGVSGRTILRLMDKGTKANLIQRQGKGAATRYHFGRVEEAIRKAA